MDSEIFFVEDVPLVEFMYFVFTRIPGESYCRPRCVSLLAELFLVCKAYCSA